MEEILILVLQMLFEVVLQFLAYGGLDIMAWTFTGKEDRSGGVGCTMMFVFGAIGAAIAGLVTWWHPEAFLSYPWQRMTNLIVGPLLAGGASWLFADARRRHGAKSLPMLHFWFAFCFVLGYDVVRFIFAHH